MVKLLFAAFCLLCISARAQTPSGRVQIKGHVPSAQMAKATHMGRLASDTIVTISVPMKVPNEAALAELIKHQHTPGDLLYGQYLTPAQFAGQFGPSQSDVDSVVSYLKAQGLTISEVHANRLLIVAQGSSANVESAFGVELHQYQKADGRVVYAPTANPSVDSAIAAKIHGITGLDSFTRRKPHFKKLPSASRTANAFTGSGPSGGMIVKDILAAYNVNTSLTGAGQSVALVELDGYTATDIKGYATSNSITNATLVNELIAGFSGTPTPLSNANSGAIEVTLDIEMLMAIAPGLSKIYVYEGPPTSTDAQWLMQLSRIASDDFAKVVSCSWGAPESQTLPATAQSENTIFMQMAAQGQTFFVASGDSGAYADGTNLGVQDPGSQPYVVAVGGTTLSLNTGGSYLSESSWGVPAAGQTAASGGGGGVSTTWPIPSYQTAAISATNSASSSMRNVPDVALNSNPNSGYDIYLGGSLQGLIGGTSAAAPLWAAWTAQLNQQRAAAGLGAIGQINIPLYSLAESSLYGANFYDVTDGSTNLHYSAVKGYDLSTGWGSFNGTALLATMAGPSTSLPPGAPGGLSYTVIGTK